VAPDEAAERLAQLAEGAGSVAQSPLASPAAEALKVEMVLAEEAAPPESAWVVARASQQQASLPAEGALPVEPLERLTDVEEPSAARLAQQE
jgi:hypothetical protein